MSSPQALLYPGNENYKPGSWSYLLSENPEKRKGEVFFWQWNVCWLIFFGSIVVSGIYESFDRWSYLYVGLFVSLPPVLLPLFFPRISGEQNTKWYDRYTTKANIWIVTFSFIGNYFWTHYFYKVLGCSYLMDTHNFNDVPIACYLITVAYFHLYHEASSVLLRKLWRALAKKSPTMQFVLFSIVLAMGCYVTAVMEVATIASFPYYTYPDTKAMFIVGSGFYGIYFIGSFPSFLRVDEYIGKAQFAALEKKTDAKSGMVNAQVITDVHCTALSNADGYRFTIADTFKDVFAHGMYTTILLDFWRISIGQVNGETLDKFVSWIF